MEYDIISFGFGAVFILEIIGCYNRFWVYCCVASIAILGNARKLLLYRCCQCSIRFSCKIFLIKFYIVYYTVSIGINIPLIWYSIAVYVGIVPVRYSISICIFIEKGFCIPIRHWLQNIACIISIITVDIHVIYTSYNSNQQQHYHTNCQNRRMSQCCCTGKSLMRRDSEPSPEYDKNHRKNKKDIHNEHRPYHRKPEYSENEERKKGYYPDCYSRFLLFICVLPLFFQRTCRTVAKQTPSFRFSCSFHQ